MPAVRLGVIGGGASGVFAAITAKEKNPYIDCSILESSSELLDKVKISGGGRCNVTHHCFEVRELIKKYPRGGKELQSLFYRFQPQDIIEWFESKGVKLKTESDGRMFPVTDSSRTIIDCLEGELRTLNIKVIYNSRIVSVTKPDSVFEVVDNNKNVYRFDALVVATGSSKHGHEIADSFGHTIVKPVPSLFTFKIEDERLHGLSGVSVGDVETKLDTGGKQFQERGPLLVTHWGLSGPAVLKLSAFAARELHSSRYKAKLIINFLPERKEEVIRSFFIENKKDAPKKSLFNIHPDEIPKRLWQSLLGYVSVDSAMTFNQVKSQTINQIIMQLFHAEFEVKGKGIFKEEFVTAGGVFLKEIDFKTMQSTKCQNLYFCGEILDIDGITGGFNFQNAWSTGFVAGCSLAER